MSREAAQSLLIYIVTRPVHYLRENVELVFYAHVLIVKTLYQPVTDWPSVLSPSTIDASANNGSLIPSIYSQSM